MITNDGRNKIVIGWIRKGEKNSNISKPHIAVGIKLTIIIAIPQFTKTTKHETKTNNDTLKNIFIIPPLFIVKELCLVLIYTMYVSPLC
jgi:hypothetical protein